MKKIRRGLVWLMVLMVLALSVGCGEGKVINGQYHDTYGFFNEQQERNPKVCYRVIVGNVVWGIVLMETIIAPIYFFGFSLFEPAPDDNYCCNKFTD